jgi:hypothetical protein
MRKLGEKQILITVAEKIGSTLGQAAALGQVATKASKAKIDALTDAHTRCAHEVFI